jgi:hypothetical protein
MTFDDREYTLDSLIKELVLIEKHSKDGSALDAGCACIESKHLYAVEGLAEEGVLFAMSKQEREFYEKLAELARKLRKNIEEGRFEIPHNPTGRQYLPHGLTQCEKKYPSVKRKLSSCIKQVEKREGCTPPYTDCPVNPVAVCRTSIPCPPR